MSKKITTILLVCAALSMHSCKKSKHYTVEGMVTNRYSGEPIDGVELSFSYGQISYGSVSGGYELLGSSMSDAQGKYNFTFDPVSASSFKVHAQKAGYLLQEYFVDNTEWSTDEINRLNVDLLAEAVLNIKYVNYSDQSGRAVVKLGRHSEGCTNCCSSQESYVFEGIVDTTVSCGVYADQTISYTLTKIEDGVANQSEYELYAEKGENTISIVF